MIRFFIRIQDAGYKLRVASCRMQDTSVKPEAWSLKPEKGFSLIELLVTLALMVLLVIFLGSKISNMDVDQRFDKTCHIMEELKEAIIGRQAFYCNGIRQFTGYVSDMGSLPGLFYINKDGEAIKVQKEDILSVLEEGHRPQPRALWTRDINGDGENDMPDEALWRYHSNVKLWAGWKGPYIGPSPGGALRDAWGNPFVFIIGELVSHKGRAYRCIKTHNSGLGKNIDKDALEEPYEPGTADGVSYWEKLPMHINSKLWIHPGKGIPYPGGNPLDIDNPYVLDIFYDDTLEIISYGKDGKPGGGGLNKDLVITIHRQEWTGEVAGHAGYNRGGHKEIYADTVSLHYPKFTEEGGDVLSKTIAIKGEVSGQSIDCGYGINFRFGIACEDGDPNCEIDCNHSECNYKNFQKASVPIGIRSIKAGGKSYIFSVIAGGTWVGTVR